MIGCLVLFLFGSFEVVVESDLGVIFIGDKMSCFCSASWKETVLFAPFLLSDNHILLFIFLCRIYFKKAIFVTYKFCVDVGFFKLIRRYGRTGNAGESNRAIDS